MEDINVAIVGGKVGELGAVSKSGTGDDVLNFTIFALERRTERGTGRPRRAKTWHRITAYGPLAQVAAKLSVGTSVLVQGRFQHNRHTKQGVVQHTVDIIAEKIANVSATAADASEGAAQ